MELLRNKYELNLLNCILCKYKLHANASSHQNYVFRYNETVCEAMFKLLAETALRGGT